VLFYYLERMLESIEIVKTYSFSELIITFLFSTDDFVIINIIVVLFRLDDNIKKSKKQKGEILYYELLLN
jgi:hypothetical protein